ncbi:MAG: hypothetical protein ACWGNV_03805 [Bacteroidales bacterium]
METIKLPESELAEMKSFYQEEYDKTIKRLEHIKTMLVRLGSEEQPDLPAPVRVKKPASDHSSASPAPVKKRRRKTRRKSKWELLIMKRLRQLDKPVTYDELTDEILNVEKLPESKRKSTKQAVVNVIFRLRNRDGKLDTFSIGTREKYIALKNWFAQPGEIKKEYAAKIERPATAGKSKGTRQKRSRKKA